MSESHMWHPGIALSLASEQALRTGDKDSWKHLCQIAAERHSDHTIAVWSSARISSPLKSPKYGGPTLLSVTWVNKNLIATGSESGHVQFWNPHDNSHPVASYKLARGPVTQICSAPGGSVLALCEGSVYSCSSVERDGSSVIRLPVSNASCVLGTAEGGIVIGTHDGRLLVSRVGHPGSAEQLSQEEYRIDGLALSREGELYSLGSGRRLRWHGPFSTNSAKAASTPKIAIAGENIIVTSSGGGGDVFLWDDLDHPRNIATGYEAGVAVASVAGGPILVLRNFGQIARYAKNGEPIDVMSTDFTWVSSIAVNDEGKVAVAGREGMGILEPSHATESHFFGDPSLDFRLPVPIQSRPGVITAVSDATRNVLTWSSKSGPAWTYISNSPYAEMGSNIDVFADSDIVVQQRSTDDFSEKTILVDNSLRYKTTLPQENCFSWIVLKDGKILCCVDDRILLATKDNSASPRYIASCQDAILLELPDGNVACAEGNIWEGARNFLSILDLESPSNSRQVAELEYPAQALSLSPDGELFIYSDKSVYGWNASGRAGVPRLSSNVHSLSLLHAPTTRAISFRSSGLKACQIGLLGGAKGLAKGFMDRLTIWASPDYALQLAGETTS